MKELYLLPVSHVASGTHSLLDKEFFKGFFLCCLNSTNIANRKKIYRKSSFILRKKFSSIKGLGSRGRRPLLMKFFEYFSHPSVLRSTLNYSLYYFSSLPLSLSLQSLKDALAKQQKQGLLSRPYKTHKILIRFEKIDAPDSRK